MSSTGEHANPSKGKIKYFPPQANPNCACCKENSKRLDTFEKQQNTIIEILAEHKVLLDRLVSQNASVENIMGIFPINTEEKLKEFDTLLATQSDPYKRHIKTLIGGNVERNLHQVFGQGIIMNFNVDGNFGKRRLKDFGNVFAAIIDVISSFNNSADKTLRAAFQRQKKKYFKQQSRNNSNNKTKNENEENESISSVEEQ